MSVTISQVEKILQNPPKVSQFGLGMLLTNLSNLYSKDPSILSLQTYADELNAYLLKFSPVLGRDLDILEEI